MRFYDPKTTTLQRQCKRNLKNPEGSHKIIGIFKVMITDNGSNFLKTFNVSSPNELPQNPDSSQDEDEEPDEPVILKNKN